LSIFLDIDKWPNTGSFANATLEKVHQIWMRDLDIRSASDFHDWHAKVFLVYRFF